MFLMKCNFGILENLNYSNSNVSLSLLNRLNSVRNVYGFFNI